MKPQLATNFDGNAVDCAYLVEPKIDGLRGIIVLDPNNPRIISRNGKQLQNHDHLLALLMKKGSGYVLDGEFYAGSWEKTMTACRKANSSTEATFWAFDAIPLADFRRGKCASPQTTRRTILKRIVAGCPGVIVTPQRTVNSHREIMEAYKQYAAKGFEGAMLKVPGASYTSGRSRAWLKVKGVKENDYRITGFQEGTGKYVGMLGAIMISVHGRKCKVGTGLTDDQRSSFWRRRNSLLGKIVQVQYQEKTKDGSLRFPRFMRLRLDK